jgi:hypothetical protein
MTDIVLAIGDPDDMDWKNHFADVRVADPQTAYMHRDSSIKRVKAMIYLNEVNMENGPTSYVLGSNNFKTGFWEYIVHKANDRADLDKCNPKARELFSALPTIFQKKAEFGNYLTDSDPAAKELLAKEHKFTSTDGIHRGGMVVRGQRRVLIIVFKPK